MANNDLPREITGTIIRAINTNMEECRTALHTLVHQELLTPDEMTKVEVRINQRAMTAKDVLTGKIK